MESVLNQSIMIMMFHISHVAYVVSGQKDLKVL